MRMQGLLTRLTGIDLEHIRQTTLSPREAQRRADAEAFILARFPPEPRPYRWGEDEHVQFLGDTFEDIPDLMGYRWLARNGEPVSWELSLYRILSAFGLGFNMLALVVGLACMFGLAVLGTGRFCLVGVPLAFVPSLAYGMTRHILRRRSLRMGLMGGLLPDIMSWTSPQERYQTRISWHECQRTYWPTSQEFTRKLGLCIGHVFAFPEGVGVHLDFPAMLSGRKVVSSLKDDIVSAHDLVRGYTGGRSGRRDNWSEGVDIYLREDTQGGASLVMIKRLDFAACKEEEGEVEEESEGEVP